MLGSEPGNSGAPLVTDGVGDDDDDAPMELAGAVAVVAGSNPVACASAAVNSPELRRTSLLSPGPLGWSRLFTLSWKDWALAAVAAAVTGGATGAGLRNTSTSVRTEIANVTRLMTRCHLK